MSEMIPKIFSIQQDQKILSRSNPGTLPNIGEMGPVPETTIFSKVGVEHGGEITKKDKVEDSGLDVDYYLINIAHPKRLKPYDAECEDIIERLEMTFAEGNAFKAIWRRCAARVLGKKKKGDSQRRNAEKVIYCGQRMLAKDLLDEEQAKSERS